ncbi:MAG: hypothetical protein ACTHN5_15470 [Phycisphaerae bacterium]
MSEERDLFDDVLAGALRARPEHVPMVDVAALAMERARVREAGVRRLARISIWTRVCSAAAVLLVVATVAVAYWEWPASSSTSSSTSVSDSTGTGSSTSSSSSLDWTTVGGGAFVLALLAVGGLMVLTPERPSYRLTPA